jgi:hypothetical protein
MIPPATVLSGWLRTQTCAGAHCGGCGNPFTWTGAGRFRGVAGVPNGAGYSMYALCRRCARQFKRQGPAANFPNAVKDSMLATLLHFLPAKGTV